MVQGKWALDSWILDSWVSESRTPVLLAGTGYPTLSQS